MIDCAWIGAHARIGNEIPRWTVGHDQKRGRSEVVLFLLKLRRKARPGGVRPFENAPSQEGRARASAVARVQREAGEGRAGQAEDGFQSDGGFRTGGGGGGGWGEGGFRARRVRREAGPKRGGSEQARQSEESIRKRQSRTPSMIRSNPRWFRRKIPHH